MEGPAYIMAKCKVPSFRFHVSRENSYLAFYCLSLGEDRFVMLNEIKDSIFSPKEVFIRLWSLEKTAMSAITWGDEMDCWVGPDRRLVENGVGDKRIVLRGDDECGQMDVSENMPGSGSFIIIKRVVVAIVL